MEMKGFSSYSGSDVVPEKRQPAAPNANLTTASRPAVPVQNADTTQFRQPGTTPQPLPQTPALAPMPAPVNILPFLGAGFEKLASMVASFFKGNQRDTVDEEFDERWEQNEIANPDLDQNNKVQDAHQSNMGGGGNQ